jgi:hypothetical protein
VLELSVNQSVLKSNRKSRIGVMAYGSSEEEAARKRVALHQLFSQAFRNVAHALLRAAFTLL